MRFYLVLRTPYLSSCSHRDMRAAKAFFQRILDFSMWARGSSASSALNFHGLRVGCACTSPQTYLHTSEKQASILNQSALTPPSITSLRLLPTKKQHQTQIRGKGYPEKSPQDGTRRRRAPAADAGVRAELPHHLRAGAPASVLPVGQPSDSPARSRPAFGSLPAVA